MELNNSFLHLLHRASQASDHMFNTSSTGKGLTARQFIILQAVAQNPHCTQSVIVGLTGIDRSTISDMLVRMHSKGLIQRERSPSDARSYEISLSPQGAAVLADATPAVQQVEENIRELTGDLQGRELLRMLSIIASAMPVSAAAPPDKD